MNILVNLPGGFFTHPHLAPVWTRLRLLGKARFTSHDDAVDLAPELRDTNAVLMWSWPAWTDDLLGAAPNLDFAGHIDISQSGARAILQRDIAVSISRHGFSPAVAELALALLLNLFRGVSNYHSAMRTGEETWVEQFPDDIPHHERELTGAKVGIIGFGRVGQRLAQLLAPFACELRVYDPFAPDEAFTRYGAQGVSLDTLLGESDAVVLCAASNDGSRHLLGEREIAMFRPNAVFVNVARAALVDSAALCGRLEVGDMLAALDVFDVEPLHAESVLRRLPNAYLTPHRAGGTLASVARTLNWLIDDLEAHCTHQPQRHALVTAMLPSLDA